MISASQFHGKRASKEKEYLAGWQRARADLENVRKRMADSATHQRTALKRDIAESLLGLADNFRSLVEHAPQKENDPWVMGVLHVARQFEQTLEEFGVTGIQETGVAFDPKIHEAVEESKSSEQPGTVLEIVQAGYRIGDVTIRPAKVKVAA